jgi:hypothetical protein
MFILYLCFLFYIFSYSKNKKEKGKFLIKKLTFWSFTYPAHNQAVLKMYRALALKRINLILLDTSPICIGHISVSNMCQTDTDTLTFLEYQGFLVDSGFSKIGLFKMKRKKRKQLQRKKNLKNVKRDISRIRI